MRYLPNLTLKCPPDHPLLVGYLSFQFASFNFWRLVLHYGTGVTSLPSRGRYSWYVSLSARVTNASVPIFRVRNKLLASS